MVNKNFENLMKCKIRKPDIDPLEQIHFDIAASIQKVVEEIVIKILKLIKSSEFKRRQSAPGARITKCSFGRDWRYPISNYFSEHGD